MIDLRLFRIPSFSGSLLINFVSIFVAVGYFLFIAQYLQLVLGLSPLEAGLWSLPSAIGFIVGSQIAPRLVRSSGPRRSSGPGWRCRPSGSLLLTQVGATAALAPLVRVARHLARPRPGAHADDRPHRRLGAARAGRRRLRHLGDRRGARRRARASRSSARSARLSTGPQVARACRPRSRPTRRAPPATRSVAPSGRRASCRPRRREHRRRRPRRVRPGHARHLAARRRRGDRRRRNRGRRPPQHRDGLRRRRASTPTSSATSDGARPASRPSPAPTA